MEKLKTLHKFLVHACLQTRRGLPRFRNFGFGETMSWKAQYLQTCWTTPKPLHKFLVHASYNALSKQFGIWIWWKDVVKNLQTCRENSKPNSQISRARELLLALQTIRNSEFGFGERMLWKAQNLQPCRENSKTPATISRARVLLRALQTIRIRWKDVVKSSKFTNLLWKLQNPCSNFSCTRATTRSPNKKRPPSFLASFFVLR